MGEQKRDAMTNGYGESESAEIAAVAFNLLRDAYYRISYIDLNKNEVRNLKIVDAEWEDEKLCCFAYDRLIENCAKKHVHESDREKFIRLMKTENLRNCFAVKQDTVEFTYRRLVGETYRWVQTEIVPLEDYSEDRARAVWYVKNITEEKVREAEYNKALRRNNAELQEANDSLRRQMAIVGSLSDIYLCCYEANLLTKEYREINAKPFLRESIPSNGSLRAGFEAFQRCCVQESFWKNMDEFTDLDSLSRRMQDTNIVSLEYPGLTIGWCRLSFIAVERDGDGRPVTALVVSQDITGEKMVEERLSRKLYGDLQEQNRKLSDALLMRNQAARALECERRQYRDALTLNSEFSYGLDLTDGFLREEITDRTGEDVLAKTGVTLPVNIDIFFEACERLYQFQPLSSGMEKLWRRDELIQAFHRGETDVEAEFYLKSVDSYLRYSILLFQDDETEHIHAFVIGRDITAARRQEELARQALEEAYDAANAANAAKTDFLSSMSHDIRTPMNAIIGMTAIAASHIDDREKVADALKKITISSRHLLGLINEILDMSKIEAGKMSLNEEAFNLSELLANLITMVHPQIQEHGHELQVRIHDIVHEDVLGDSLRIQQAFVNIMGNAIKYTPDGGRITLTVAEKPISQPRTGCYEFVFEDNGIGMTREYVEKIFLPFTRAEDSRVSKIQGTGLGMPITQNIVRMMNGNIEVESEPGKGSRFTATIFLKLQETDLPDTSGLEGLFVLVADDDRISCESTCCMLEEIGMDGEWVLSGREALERVVERHRQARDYFAVILDWKMPDMSGVETAREIRKVVGNDVPIIILSAYDWTDIEFEARAAGVNGFLCKPVFKSGLTRLFRMLIGDEEECAQESGVRETMEADDLTGKRVLLVEDNDINREIASEILGMTGLCVEEAVDGKQAVDLFEQSEEGYYDMVLMDIQMPVMNGYQATMAIRAMKRKDALRIPILAMTANAFAEDVLAAKNAGMNEHLAKPLDFGRLQEALSRWLA